MYMIQCILQSMKRNLVECFFYFTTPKNKKFYAEYVRSKEYIRMEWPSRRNMDILVRDHHCVHLSVS
jgi:hypothetical protein